MGTRKRRVQVNDGDRYGMLTVIREVDAVVYPSGPARQALCMCDCGNEKVVVLHSIRGGQVKSCGCYHDMAPVKHGQAVGGNRSATYRSWMSMRSRCLNENSSDYDRYGGRGISICDRWETYEAFFEDMGDRPSEQHSIDRIDPEGNYEPNNCRWATAKQQGRNRRNNRMLTHGGETMCLSEWAERTGLSLEVIRQRIQRGYTVHDALTIQLGGKARAN